MRSIKERIHMCKQRTILLIALFAALSLSLAACAGGKTGGGSADGGDLVIPVSAVTEKAAFYPVTVDGTKLEVFAVKAADGTIRTAFNTCQVCYSSGRGYYKQEGAELVCQNCGNRFTTDQVEVVHGGCNPVPILAENKTEDGTSITIPYEFLSASRAIFATWKSAA
jgi:uncharacterized membrane protein